MTTLDQRWSAAVGAATRFGRAIWTAELAPFLVVGLTLGGWVLLTAAPMLLFGRYGLWVRARTWRIALHLVGTGAVTLLLMAWVLGRVGPAT